MTVLGRNVQDESVSNTVFGMIVVAFGTGLFCTAGAIAQYSGGSILQLMIGSYMMQNMIAWAWWCIRKPRQAVNWFGDSPHKSNIWIRGLLYWVMMFCWWKGLEMVPIGDAEAIIFVSPMVTVFLAKFLLEEELPRGFPVTFVLTVAALIFICQPEFIFGATSGPTYSQVSWAGMIFLFVTIFCWAAVSLLVRTAKEAHWLQVNLVTSFQAAWMWTPLLAILNHFVGNNLGEGNGDPLSNSDASNVAWIDGSDFSDWDWAPATMLTIVAIAFFEFFAVMCKVVGYQLGEATKVASMEYLDIVFAFFFQYFLFHRTPDMWEYIGAALLIISCMLQFIEEKWFPRVRNGEHIVQDEENDKESLLFLLDKGEDSIENENASYGSSSTKVTSMDILALRESSHSHINFDGINIETFKDVVSEDMSDAFIL